MTERKASLLFFVLFCLLIGGLAAFNLQQSLTQEQDKAQERVSGTSYLIAEWVRGSFEVTDYLLRDILGHVRREDIVYPTPDPQAHERLSKLIISKMGSVPNAILIGLFDKNCIFTHGNKTGIGWDGSQRDYCIGLRDDPNRRTFVSNAYKSSTGPINVTQSRRYLPDEPGFHGFAAVGVDLTFFSQWLSNVAIGPYGVIAISDMNLNLLARKPADPESLGKKVNELGIEGFVASGEIYKTFRETSPLDGESRLYGVRKVDGLPFIIVVGEAERDWLADWKHDRNIMIFAVFIAGVLAFFIFRIYLKNSSLLKREVELVKQYNDEQKQLLAMLTHEFLTPIAIIDASTKSLQMIDDQNGDENDDRKRRYERIRKAVIRMNSMLEMGTIQMRTDNLPFEPLMTDIQSLTFEVIELAQANTTSNIFFEGLDDEILARVDPGLMKIAMLNVLDNAIKYSAADSEIKITCRHLTDEGIEGINWAVYDQGPGVAADDQDKIFQKGFRGQHVGNTSGLGLGLYLVKKMVEKHQGKLSMCNLSEGGAVFRLWFPL